MKLKLLLCSCFALLFCSLSSNAQSEREVRMWLTTPDRTALVAPQAAALHFSPEAGQLPVLAVDDAQHFQSIDGFGFALTGGSAQLLMRMGAAQRAALLKELFATGDSGIGVSYLRVSIGSSDMNERVFSYDDLPPGETDVEMAKFNLGPDRTNVIPVLKEILEIRPVIKILGSPWSAPAWMKTNNDVKAGQLRPEYYGAFAKYFVNYIEAMHTEGLRKDEAIAEADTLLLTIPNQLGVDYNAHVMEAILTTVWLARNLAVDPFHSIGGSKWQAPRERLVQSDAQGVEIAARINRAIHPTGLFGGHIGEGEQLAGPGAMQFRSGAEVEKFSQKDGLSADDTSAVLEDREPIDEEIPAQLSAIMTRLVPVFLG